MEVTRTLGFRRGYSGFYEGFYEDFHADYDNYYDYSSVMDDPGCTQGHIDKQTPASMGYERISGIGDFLATYIVTNIEDSSLLASSKTSKKLARESGYFFHFAHSFSSFLIFGISGYLANFRFEKFCPYFVYFFQFR